MACPLCVADKKPECYVWRYNYLTHLQVQHAEQHQPTDLEINTFALKTQEFQRVLLSQLGTSKAHQAKVAAMVTAVRRELEALPEGSTKALFWSKL